MSTSKAFDTALFVGTPSNSNDGVVIDVIGPPFTTKFQPMVTGGGPGVVVGASVPAATAAGQALQSGATAGFPWTLVTAATASAPVPAPGGQNHVLLSDVTPAWRDTTLNAMLLAGGAVLTSVSSTFGATANLAFTPSAALTTRIDGGDPAKSAIDNMTIDCGTF